MSVVQYIEFSKYGTDYHDRRIREGRNAHSRQGDVIDTGTGPAALAQDALADTVKRSGGNERNYEIAVDRNIAIVLDY